MLDNIHGAGLRALCIKKGLDVSNVKGKEAYLKLLKGNQMEIITAVTPQDLKSVGLDKEAIRIDKLKEELNALRIPMRVPGRGVVERKFGKEVNYSIDKEERTIHFLGNCLGPICTTLQQPDAVIMKVAKHYLGTFTWDAKKAKHVAGMGHEDDEKNAYLDQY